MAPLPFSSGERGVPAFPDSALLERLEAIPDPALIYLPGGRIAAVNQAAARLSDTPVVGMTMRDLLLPYGARLADGSPAVNGDLPYKRALRGEHVIHGERIEATLADGSTFHVVVESTPILADGQVVAAFSVWHDFDAYLERLAGGYPDADGTAGPR